MILVFGGAYQGKLDYVLENFDLSEKDVFKCERDSMHLNFDRKVIYGLHNFVYCCVKEGFEARDILEEHAEKLGDKIIICDDISQGIVPLDKTERAWREATGRCMVVLGKKADRVIRVFCGLGMEIK